MHLRWKLPLALLVASGLATATSQAEAASCDGVPAWSQSTIYQPGDQLVYKDHLYKASIPIWNAAPDYCPSCAWYQDLGSCSASDGGDPNPPANQPPVVNLTAPANGAQYTLGDAVAVSAAASDADGSVAKVEFFQGQTSIGVRTAAPWSASFTPAATGSYVLKAVATDDKGAQATSASVNITVKPGDTTPPADTVPPSVPTGLNASALSQTSVAVSWNTSSDNVGVSGYDVLRDGKQVAQVATTSLTDVGLAAATTYSYSVRARDAAGNVSAQSAAVKVTTQAPAPDPDPDPDPNPQPGPDQLRNIGYFTAWGIYDRGYTVKNLVTSGSAQYLTHINYAFGNVRNNVCEVGKNIPSNENTGEGGDAWADYAKSFSAGESVSGQGDTWDQPLRGNWNQLKQLKAKYPKLKVLISLGGWTWSRGFASAAKPENRAAFVKSCIDAYILGNLPKSDDAGGPGAAAGVFDGIDIDWEYPAACGLTCGSAEERANFTGLMAEFRRQLDAVRPGLLLTAAIGAGVDKIRVTDPGQYKDYVDFVNVMTYDFHGGWESVTGFHSALYAPANDPSTGDAKQYNTDAAIRALIAAGMPAAKINLGIGFYGRGWTNVANVNNGLFQSGTAAPARYEAGIEDWKLLKDLAWPQFNDTAAGAHWIYNGTTFWSFDDPALIKRKMDYVKANGLGGAFSWEFSGDDANGTLLKAMASGLAK